jgi:LDH2 family malate/lactate/ureidoglycolate dehydrogenase
VTNGREVFVAPGVMTPFLVSLFAAFGTPRDNAEIVVTHLVDSSLAGLHSHGVLRVPDYLDAVATGAVDAAAVPELVDDGPVAVLDARRGFGQVAAAHALAEVRQRVGGGGTAVVALRKAGHLGRIGAYVEQLAHDGLVAVAFCSVPTRFHNVAWSGTRQGRLGTNPIAYAFPTNREPVVADFSTSAVPEGRIRFLRNQGLPAPAGLLRDANGDLATDPNVLYADPPGALQPLGSPDLGHKGSALGLLVEAMGTLLAGETSDDPDRDNNLTLFAFATPEGFASRASGLVDHIHRAVPIDADRPPMVPGEPEARARAAAQSVLVDPATWEAIAARAAAKDLTLPPLA